MVWERGQGADHSNNDPAGMQVVEDTPRAGSRLIVAAVRLLACAAVWGLLASPAVHAGDMTIHDAVKRLVAENKRLRIAVFDFSNTDGTRTRYDVYIADTIVNELSKYPVTLLERKRLETLLGEQALSQTGVVDASKALKLGTLLPVDVVASGSYTEMGSTVVINGRFIHVGTGEILSAFTSSIDRIADPSAPKDDRKSACERTRERVRKALYTLQDADAVSRAVGVAIEVPFDTDCGAVHYEVIQTFVRHRIKDRRYRAFLLSTLRGLDTPSEDGRAVAILGYLASDGAIDQEEWSSGVDCLKKMRTYSLDVPLRPLLNAGKEQGAAVLVRVDELMQLASEERIGRPVPARSITVFYAVMGALEVRDRRVPKDTALAVFRKYQVLIPDDDTNNKKAMELLRGMYFADDRRGLSKEALALLIDFLRGRSPSDQLAEETADLVKTLQARVDDRSSQNGPARDQVREDLAAVNRSLASLYCLSVSNAKKKGYHYIVDERSLHVLRNRMQCPVVPTIQDLERDMGSGDWDRKLKAIELLSQSGDAAKDAEKTVIKYLGQQGYGSQGGRLRRLCALTLGNIRTTDPEGISRLIASFPDFEDGVSHEAEESIRKIGAPALPYLIKGLGSKDHAIRLRCATALGALGGKARHSLPELQRLAASDSDPYVRKEAQGAVQMITNDF